MPHHGPAHRSIAWSKQKLDELDALLTELDVFAAQLKGKAATEADKALGRIRQSRDVFRAYVAKGQADLEDTARTGVAKAESAIDDARAHIEKERVEAELAFQSFLSTASADADFARKALAARVKADRNAFDDSLDSIGDETEAAIEAARKDFDTALNRLSGEADKAETGAARVSAAGQDAWEAIREGLKEVHAVHARTAKRVAEAFARLR